MNMLDEIYEAVKEMRNRGGRCPFISKALKTQRHEWCALLFPEIAGTYTENGYTPNCPCYVLGFDYVKSEMQRLFP